jgi:drug/metabolite transporter (DMT)-like permease
VQIVGLAVVLTGLALIGWTGATSTNPDVWKGDLLFLCTGLIWGGYPLMLQSWKLDALTSTAVVSVLSLTFIPIYVVFFSPQLLDVHWSVVAFHAVNQGILNSIVGLWLWAQAVALIGAGPSGRFPPLIPVIGTLTAIPLLGEWPNAWQVAGVTMIVGGLLVVATARK